MEIQKTDENKEKRYNREAWNKVSQRTANLQSLLKLSKSISLYLKKENEPSLEINMLYLEVKTLTKTGPRFLQLINPHNEAISMY